MLRTVLSAGLVAGALIGLPAARGELRITHLHCEYTANPLGIDAARPLLGWKLESSERSQRQTAYQVLVASTRERLDADQPDLWDSGKVTAADALEVEYAGRALKSGQQAWWKVRAWDREGRPCPYSSPSSWETALLRDSDWQGRWICSPRPLPAREEDFYADQPAPLFRKEFTADGQVVRARAYVTGLGYYELYLNGRRVGDHVLDPGWTTYSRRVLYSTYDVTDLIREGRNCAGAIVGNGWYNPLPLRFWGAINLREHLTLGRPRLLLQLNIDYADGTRQSVFTDETWRTGDSPILRNSVYLGEVYDARRELPGWCEPGFDDAQWLAVAGSGEPVGRLEAQSTPPIKVTHVLRPVKVTEPAPGVRIYDFGQNFAGWARLMVNAPAGTAVTMRYGELLRSDGTLNVMTSVAGQIKSKGVGGPGAPNVAWQSDTYICRGGSLEIYAPRFTFHGFRYVEVSGLPGTSIESIEGLRLNSAVEPVGTFECSDATLNRIHAMVVWTLLSNLFSVQSDCPHREKFGYGGDIVASSEMAMFNCDMARFYAKAVHDLHDAARPNGGLTETAPFVGIADHGFGDGTGPLEWGTAHPVLLQQLHQYYGRRRLLEEQYPTARKWVEFLRTQARDHLIENGISDHESLVPKPVTLTGTGFYFYNAQVLSQLAKRLDYAEDHAAYKRLGDSIRDALNHKHLRPGSGAYGPVGEETQCAQALALYMDLVPGELRTAALKGLIDNIDQHQGHLTTGIFGTKFMLDVLGRFAPDTAYGVVGRKGFPGWVHMLEGGATTLWEHWEFSDNTYSHNHPMFGSVDEWLYKHVAGISPAPEAVGFDRILIRPRPGGGLIWARAQYNSIRGPVRSEWRLTDGVFRLRVHVPVSAVGFVDLPAAGGAHITESGRPLNEAPGVNIQPPGDGPRILVIDSGDYEFVVEP